VGEGPWFRDDDDEWQVEGAVERLRGMRCHSSR
jgi:hypothetical protein